MTKKGQKQSIKCSVHTRNLAQGPVFLLFSQTTPTSGQTPECVNGLTGKWL